MKSLLKGIGNKKDIEKLYLGWQKAIKGALEVK